MPSVFRFLKDRSGSVAMLFAALLVPIVAFAGMAVDFARTFKIRTNMQIAESVFVANAKLS